MNQHERKLLKQITDAGLPAPVVEFLFHPVRGWRFDFAWPELKLAVEYEGAVFVQGRHTRGKGFVEDCEKYNAAVLLGWRVLRFTDKHLWKQRALKVITKALGCG